MDRSDASVEHVGLNEVQEGAEGELNLTGEWANIKPGTVLTLRRMTIYANPGHVPSERKSKKVVKSARVVKEFGGGGSALLSIRFKKAGKKDRVFKMNETRRGGYILNSYEKPPVKYEVEAIDGTAV